MPPSGCRLRARVAPQQAPGAYVPQKRFGINPTNPPAFFVVFLVLFFFLVPKSQLARCGGCLAAWSGPGCVRQEKILQKTWPAPEAPCLYSLRVVSLAQEPAVTLIGIITNITKAPSSLLGRLVKSGLQSARRATIFYTAQVQKKLCTRSPKNAD